MLSLTLSQLVTNTHIHKTHLTILMQVFIFLFQRGKQTSKTFETQEQKFELNQYFELTRNFQSQTRVKKFFFFWETGVGGERPEAESFKNKVLELPRLVKKVKVHK